MTSASSTLTFFCLRNTWRIGGAICPGGEHPGRHLVEQRLEKVVVSPVDERHIDAADGRASARREARRNRPR